VHDLSILVPVLGRPERAASLVDSVGVATRLDWEVVFLLSPDDPAEDRAVRELADQNDRVSWRRLKDTPGPGDYARKINVGFATTSAAWVFQAADDLRFRPGWDTIAVDTGAKYGAGVVGTNDLCNPRVIRGRHSTHSLIRRAYVDECGGSNEPGKVLCEAYEHNYVDDELVSVAASRGCFVMSPAVVEHLHPNCGKAETGETYALGRRGYHRDRALFLARRPHWERAARQAGHRAL
jgi:hypothetical protein